MEKLSSPGVSSQVGVNVQESYKVHPGTTRVSWRRPPGHFIHGEHVQWENELRDDECEASLSVATVDFIFFFNT